MPPIPDLTGRRVAILAPGLPQATTAARRANLMPSSPLVRMIASPLAIALLRTWPPDAVVTIGVLPQALTDWLTRARAAAPDLTVVEL